MNVGVAYADKFEKVWLKLEVPDGSTVQQAIEHSGLLARFPQIDLDTQRVGIFGKLSKLTTKVAEGDRIEIYCPITADPETVERRDSE
ncbi:RnfH family protein [Candidatus Thiosymbion oneisti]|uniref:RnfH family protein n=1 Tax=Candidatus Thiosymbion oneisti TaxID=589554 RepID=UPI000A81E709|nr:RnfH family protein [Candidatus Thiosymbion oneisti]